MEDLEFVAARRDIEPHLKCFSCGCVLDYLALTHSCGASLCNVCVHTDKSCDCVEDEGWNSLTLELKEEIDELEVYCPYKTVGCPEILAMGALDTHQKTSCEFSALCCTCQQRVNQAKMHDHRKNQCRKRKITCPWCLREGHAFDIEEHARDLGYCVKVFANMANHPLVVAPGKNKRKKAEAEEENLDDEFYVPDDYEDVESKKTIKRQYKRWREKKH